MKWSKEFKRQFVFEAIMYMVQGFMLVLLLFNMTIKFMFIVLIVEYFLSIVNTICWFLWVNKADTKKVDE
jgi:hypothetical protein